MWIESRIETAFNLGQDIELLQDVGQDLNLPTDLPPHAIDAVDTTQAPHDDGAAHRVGTPAQSFALEAMKYFNEVIPGQFDADQIAEGSKSIHCDNFSNCIQRGE